MTISVFFVAVFMAYLLLGLLFGIWFVSRGVNRLDEGMQEASWKLRLLLLPGSLGLWVILLIKYLKTVRTPQNASS